MTIQTNFFIPVQQFFDQTTHLPLAGGKVYSYVTGTLTPKSLYNGYYGTTKLKNPCTLGSDGLVDGGIWGNGSYTIIVKDPTDTTTIATYNGVSDISVSSLGNFTFSDNIITVSTGSDVILQVGGSGTYQFKGTNSSAASITLSENTGYGQASIAIQAPTSITSDRIITLPNTSISVFNVQDPYSTYVALSTLSISPNVSDTIPALSDHVLLDSKSITPKNALNILKVTVIVHGANDGVIPYALISLFQDAETSAKASVIYTAAATTRIAVLRHMMVAGSTASITLKVYVSGIIYTNGTSGGRTLGGVSACTINIEELSV
jgi:hypothetical protein